MEAEEISSLLERNIPADRIPPKNLPATKIIGQSKAIKDVLVAIEIAAQNMAPVVLKGEAGTGKELIARTIHERSGVAKGPFLKVPCDSTPQEEFEEELFGEENPFASKGAQSGLFEKAHGGTLFFEEISDVPLSIQAKMISVLEKKEFERGWKRVPFKIRYMAATTINLEDQVEAKKFREDLYYWSHIISIPVPSLRERKEDILPLAVYFLNKFNSKYGKSVKEIADETFESLMAYSWPGNVEELKNVIEKAVVSAKDTLPIDFLPSGIVKNQSPVENRDSNGDLRVAVKNLEKRMIREAMSQSGGNQRKASQFLGITERMLGYKLKIYGHR